MKSLAPLVEAARQGSEEAVEELIHIVEKKAKHIALEYMDNDDIKADDIVQQAYIRAFENIDSIENPEKFEPWFFRIVHNLGKNAVNPSKIEEASMNFSELGEEDMSFEEIAPGDYIPFQPKESFDYTELREGIKTLLETLPKDQRIAVSSYYLEGINMRQIAELFGTGESTIRMRINSAMKKMGAYIKEMEAKGTPLFGAAPASILTWFYNGELQNITVKAPDIPTIMAASGLGGIMAGASKAVIDSAGTNNASQTATGTTEHVTTGNVAKTASKTGTSFLKTGLGKLILGLVIVGAIGIGIAATANSENSGNDPTELAAVEDIEPEWKDDIRSHIERFASNGYTYFNLIDVDQDGIPEIFTAQDNGMAAFWVYNESTGDVTGWSSTKYTDNNLAGSKLYVDLTTGRILFVDHWKRNENKPYDIRIFKIQDQDSYREHYGIVAYQDGDAWGPYQWDGEEVSEDEFFNLMYGYVDRHSKQAISSLIGNFAGYSKDEVLEMIDEW